MPHLMQYVGHFKTINSCWRSPRTLLWLHKRQQSFVSFLWTLLGFLAPGGWCSAPCGFSVAMEEIEGHSAVELFLNSLRIKGSPECIKFSWSGYLLMGETEEAQKFFKILEHVSGWLYTRSWNCSTVIMPKYLSRSYFTRVSLWLN